MGDEKYVHFGWLEIRKEELGIEGRITLKMNLKETCWEGIDWINLAQDSDRW
jgi:hypothetical protein